MGESWITGWIRRGRISKSVQSSKIVEPIEGVQAPVSVNAPSVEELNAILRKGEAEREIRAKVVAGEEERRRAISLTLNEEEKQGIAATLAEDCVLMRNFLGELPEALRTAASQGSREVPFLILKATSLKDRHGNSNPTEEEIRATAEFKAIEIFCRKNGYVLEFRIFSGYTKSGVSGRNSGMWGMNSWGTEHYWENGRISVSFPVVEKKVTK
jgi:predicted Zn-dependent protease